MTPEQKLKQRFDDAAYERYCNLLHIPLQYRDENRERIIKSFGYQRFAMGLGFEIAKGEFKKIIKDLLPGRMRKK